LVSWPFLRLVAVEEFGAGPKDGAELVGFIADYREIGKWLRSGVPPEPIK
jgi:hypothetical protein